MPIVALVAAVDCTVFTPACCHLVVQRMQMRMTVTHLNASRFRFQLLIMIHK